LSVLVTGPSSTQFGGDSSMRLTLETARCGGVS